MVCYGKNGLNRQNTVVSLRDYVFVLVFQSPAFLHLLQEAPTSLSRVITQKIVIPIRSQPVRAGVTRGGKPRRISMSLPRRGI